MRAEKLLPPLGGPAQYRGLHPTTFIVWAPRTGEIYAEVLSEEEVAAVVSEVHETEPDTEIEVGVA